MSRTANMQEAKTHLSKLVNLAVAGEEVIIANRGVAMVKLVPCNRPKKRPLGFMAIPGENNELPDSFFDPLPEEDLRLWEGKNLGRALEPGR